MRASEALAERVWSKPEYYAGYSPDGEYVIASQHRDSDALERSNYRRILADLQACATQNDAPESVYDWRASHWAVGWVEYVMVRSNAPQAVLDLAGEIVCALADYPVYDESDWSELEWNETSDYWAGMSVRERIEVIERSGSNASIFAARRDYLPKDNGHVYDYLRTP